MSQDWQMPDGWKKIALGDCAEVIFSNVDKRSRVGEKRVRLCNYTDVYYRDYIDSAKGLMEASATEAEIQKFSLRRGDVLITKDSEESNDIGVPAVVTKNLDDVLCGYHLAIVRPFVDALDSAFLNQVFRSHYVRKQLFREANGVTRFGLGVGALQKLRLAAPPLRVQERIGEILAVWDKAAQVLGALVILKQYATRGLMQQLLSGKMKFKEFESGRRRSLHLGDVVAYEPRATIKPNGAFLAAGVRSHGKGVFLKPDFDAKDIALDELFQLRADDLVVNITFGWEGAVAIVPPEADDALVSHRFPTFTFKPGMSFPGYFRHVIRTKRFVHEVGLASPGGAGRNRVLSKSDFLRIPVELPPFEEQRRIASALNACDREIELLQKQLDALKEQKRGLMQKLLTGQIRVKAKEEK